MDARLPNDRRRRCKNKKKANNAAAEPPMTGPTCIQDVPLDLLKLILVRLDSSLYLIRAAYVCKLWRGIIAGGDNDGTGDGVGDFLRLSHSLHPPAIAGHYYLGKDPTSFVPTSPPATGRVGRFRSLDFLPAGKRRWNVADSHGGLVLLFEPYHRYYPDLIVCDPLTRRHQGIIHPKRGISPVGVFLLDGDAGSSGVSMSNFRVLYMFYDNNWRPKAWVFTTAEAGDWRLVDTMGKDLPSFAGAYLAGRLDGCLCLGLRSGRVMVLDNASLEFFQLDLPNNRKDLWPLSNGATCAYTLPWPPLLQACVGQSRRRRQR